MSIKSSTSTGIHTNHNPPVAVAVAAAAAATATVAAAVAAAVAGKATKDLGQFRPAKDLGGQVGQDHDKTVKDLPYRPGHKNHLPPFFF